MPWQRRQFSGRDLSRVLNIADLREVARRRIPHFVFEYVEGGAEDENTLRCNRRAFEELSFIPQTLVDTTARSHRIELFGQPSTAPLIIAPTGMSGMIYPQADIALARAAASVGIPFCLSTVSTTRLEDVAASAGGRLWMQLYVMRDRAVAEDIMRHPRWMWDVLIREGMPRFRNFESFLPPGGATAVGGSTIIPKMFAPSITWDDIAWIRRHWQRKLIIKGVLSVADAQRAANLGCDGIVLTNHGGRQLDSCVAP